MAVTSHITVSATVTPTSPAPSQRQRVPCFVGVHSVTVNTADVYTSLDEMEDAGWTSSDVIYNMVAAMLAQKPVGQRPTQWFVGKRTAAVAAVWQVDVVATVDGAMTILDGDVTVASFTASTSTATEIRDGLIAAAADGYTLAIVDVDSLSITRDEAGVPMTITLGGAQAANLDANETTPAAGIFADLDTIQAFVLNGKTVGAQVWNYEIAPGLGPYGWTEAARWAHADGDHVVGSQSSDANIIASGSSADGASLVKALGYSRSDLAYRASDTDYVRAMLLGHVMPAPPASVNYSWRRLIGSTLATTTTDAVVTTLRTKRASHAELIDVDGQVKYFGGRDGTGQPMYHWSAIDNWRDNIKARLVFDLTNNDGIDFSDSGIDSILVAGIRAEMDAMVNAGTLSPNYTITALPVASVPDAEVLAGDYQTTGYIRVDAELRTFVDRVRVTGEFAIES